MTLTAKCYQRSPSGVELMLNEDALWQQLRIHLRADSAPNVGWAHCKPAGRVGCWIVSYRCWALNFIGAADAISVCIAGKVKRVMQPQLLIGHSWIYLKL